MFSICIRSEEGWNPITSVLCQTHVNTSFGQRWVLVIGSQNLRASEHVCKGRRQKHQPMICLLCVEISELQRTVLLGREPRGVRTCPCSGDLRVEGSAGADETT